LSASGFLNNQYLLKISLLLKGIKQRKKTGTKSTENPFPGFPVAKDWNIRASNAEIKFMDQTLNGAWFLAEVYFLATTSLYKSTYISNDGISRSSKYDANFASNLLLGKEFNVGKKGNKTIGVNTKISYLGGNRYTPIDVDASSGQIETPILIFR